jgi:hypothetical protein
MFIYLLSMREFFCIASMTQSQSMCTCNLDRRMRLTDVQACLSRRSKEEREDDPVQLGLGESRFAV